MSYKSQTLGQLLSKNPKIDGGGFWKSFAKLVNNGLPGENKISMKGKQVLVSAIRYSCISIDTDSYIDTTIKFLTVMPQNSSVVENFTENDVVFFQTINTLATVVMEKPESQVNDQRKLDFIAAIFHLIETYQIFHDQNGPHVASLCLALIFSRKEHSEMLNRCIALLFLLIDDVDVRDKIVSKREKFSQLILESRNPRIQLQFLELFFRLQIPIAGFDFTSLESQNFNEYAHQCLLKLNSTLQEPIFNIKFDVITNEGGILARNGWADVGFDDLTICLSDSVVVIAFEDIDGLDGMEGNLIITMGCHIEQLGVEAGQAFTIIPNQKIEPQLMSRIFNRISYGESGANSQAIENQKPVAEPAQEIPQQNELAQEAQPPEQQAPPPEKQQVPTTEQPEPAAEQPEPVAEQHEQPAAQPAASRFVRSSIAMFVPQSNIEHTSIAMENGNDLFRDSVDIPPNTFQGESITTPEDSQTEEEPSPPLLDINIGNAVQEVLPIPEDAPNKKELKEKLEIIEQRMSPPSSPGVSVKEYDGCFGMIPQNISSCLESGLKHLTANSMEQVKIFSELLRRHVDRFVDSMQSKIKERETGSVKQLDVAKSNFQENILGFKRREATIHQSLNSYEDKTKEILANLNQINKSWRSGFQGHRKDLESKLTQLRRRARNDSSDDSDSENSEEMIQNETDDSDF